MLPDARVAGSISELRPVGSDRIVASDQRLGGVLDDAIAKGSNSNGNETSFATSWPSIVISVHFDQKLG